MFRIPSLVDTYNKNLAVDVLRDLKVTVESDVAESVWTEELSTSSLQCISCKTINPAKNKECNQCGADLLPGRPVRWRLPWIGVALLIWIVFGFLATQFPPQESKNSMGLPSGNDTIVTILFFGALGYTVVSLRQVFSRTPLHEKYFLRAQRLEDIDNKQAEADYSEAKNDAYYNKRGLLYEKIGEPEKARNDFQKAKHFELLKKSQIEETQLRAEENILATYGAVTVTNQRIVVKSNMNRLQKALSGIFEGEIELKEIESLNTRPVLGGTQLFIKYEIIKEAKINLNGAEGRQVSELIQNLVLEYTEEDKL